MPWLLPCWKRVCSRLCGAATGLFSTGGGVGVRLWWCSQTLGVLTRGGTTTTTAAGSWRSSGWRGWRRRSVTGQTTILQPIGIQFHFVWGRKEWRLRFKPHLEVQPKRWLSSVVPLVLNFSCTCAVSGAAAVLLEGPSANSWAGRRNLLLIQLPISETAPSGIPWRTTLRTPHWVAVTSVREQMWIKKDKWCRLKKKKEKKPSLCGKIWVHVKRKHAVLATQNITCWQNTSIQTWWYLPRIKECWDNGILACVVVYSPQSSKK